MKKKYATHSFRIDENVFYWMKVMRSRKGGISWNKLFFNYLLDSGDQRNISALTYQKLKKDKCEECGVNPPEKMDVEDYWKQSNRLEVHHIDGDFLNNGIDNIKTLCIKCHREKHKKRK